ncbi:MAG TPA: hypothetical protein VJS13_03360 [Pyrinomonadaceae bacterium]|nr:hypothetical protein [Pyrinomonadaceae bacterium]
MTITNGRFLLLILACLIAWSSAQSQSKDASQPSRTVKGQVLTSTSLPNIRLKFDKHFKYAGTQQFVLYGRSQAEQFFFVDADKHGHISRLYLVQFEGYLPNTDATYDYAVTGTIDIHGQQYITNTESVPSVSAVLKQQPESDAARAIAFLTQKGFHAPEALRYQRFVRLVDNAKRHEFIIVYVEDTGAAKPATSANELSTRALKGITVLD